MRTTQRNYKTKVVCYALGCNKFMDVEAYIIHHHTEKEKCNPYDNDTHCYFELCKEHYLQLHKEGEEKVILKDEYAL